MDLGANNLARMPTFQGDREVHEAISAFMADMAREIAQLILGIEDGNAPSLPARRQKGIIHLGALPKDERLALSQALNRAITPNMVFKYERCHGPYLIGCIESHGQHDMEEVIPWEMDLS